MSKAPLWTVAEAAKALGLSGDFPATGIDFVTQDSRLVKPGSLFVALSGTPSGGFISSFASTRDGWDFAANAASRRCGRDDRSASDRGRQRSATGREGHADRRAVDAWRAPRARGSRAR